MVLSDVCVEHDDTLLTLCSRFGDVTHVDNGPPPGVAIRDLHWAPAEGNRPALRLHTDSAYSRFPHAAIALACAKNAADGWGDSVLAAISDAVGDVSDAQIEELTTRPVTFVKHRDGRVEHKWTAPVLGDGAYGITCRLNLDHLVGPDQAPSHHAAVTRLVELLDNATARIKLNPGDLLIIDNRRVLHGRTALAGERPRILRRLKMKEVGS